MRKPGQEQHDDCTGERGHPRVDQQQQAHRDQRHPEDTFESEASGHPPGENGAGEDADPHPGGEEAIKVRRRVQVVDDEEDVEGVEGSRSQHHYEDGNQQCPHHLVAAGELEALPQLAEEAWRQAGVAASRGGRRPDQGYQAEADHEAQRVGDQRPLDAQHEKDGHCQRRTDDRGDARVDLAQ